MKGKTYIKSFAMTNMLLESDLDNIEIKFGIDLGRKSEHQSEIESIYFPQFTEVLKNEAKQMAKHYEVFYCLEKTIRELIIDVFESSGEDNWWDNLVPENIRTNVKKSIKKEIQSAVTKRSSNPIDYTTFGELGEIIKSNWPLFGGSVFSDVKAVEKVMSNLNSLRNPIAHCSMLAEDEIMRLDLSLRDWFRMIS